jgi:hypothetical protein
MPFVRLAGWHDHARPANLRFKDTVTLSAQSSMPSSNRVRQYTMIWVLANSRSRPMHRQARLTGLGFQNSSSMPSTRGCWLERSSIRIGVVNPAGCNQNETLINAAKSTHRISAAVRFVPRAEAHVSTSMGKTKPSDSNDGNCLN